MRVLIDYRPALRERTGVGEYTHQLVRALASTIDPSKLDLTVFSSSWKDRLRIDRRELARVHTVDRHVPVALLNFAWHRLGWPPAELLARSGFDVVHSQHPLLLPARAAAQVVTIHDLSFLTHPDRAHAEIRRDYPALVRAHAHRADRIVVSSRYAAGEVERRLDVPAGKVAWCPPGAPAWPARATMPAHGYVLFVGTLEPRKNIGVLLDAYERLLARPQRADGARLPELVLAGKALDSSRPWLERMARPPLQRMVRHLGYIDAADRRALYEGARLLVLPSLEEGFGLPVLEAMTVGVPVVAADRGALPEVLGDAGLLVNPEDPEALAAAIDRLLTDEGFAAACVLKGLARSREFRWEITAARMFDVYRGAVEHRQCASA